MPHAPTLDDIEQLCHVAQDAGGAPLADEDLAFLASEQQTLRVDDHGALFVLGVAQVRHYHPAALRAAIADARAVWALVGHATPNGRGAVVVSLSPQQMLPET
ncbi:MAG TPA: hypothetical protein VEZ47_07700 [Gemmatirosa sp.]|jgi:hypothetical protein|nr:hypothetical protein [Gemmatirosa sp.]